MAYKWKPSAAQRKAFADKMKDPEQQAAYHQRKHDKAEKRRAGSNFSYSSAGGNYVPTKIQYEYAMKFLGDKELSEEQGHACTMVVSGFSCNEKVHHDYIHVVNELIRSQI